MVVSPQEKQIGSGSSTGGDASRIIVLNDSHNSFEGVALTLARVLPGISYESGMRLASLIHNSGKAVVWSGHREQAELYWEQLNESGLTMAPLEGSR